MQGQLTLNSAVTHEKEQFQIFRSEFQVSSHVHVHVW